MNQDGAPEIVIQLLFLGSYASMIGMVRMERGTIIQSAAKTKKLPEGYVTLFLVLTLLMAGFALLQGLLILYAINQFGLSDQAAYLLYTTFTALLFATPLLAGYVGEKFLGYPLAVTFGLALATAGLYLICLHSLSYLYVGLAVVIVGSASALAASFVLLGRLFQPNDHRRDAGFTFCYTGMNIGAFGALMISGTIIRHWNYNIAFLLSAMLILTALLTFIMGIRTFLRPQVLAAIESSAPRKKPMIGVFLLFAAIPIVAELLYFSKLTDIVLLLLGAVVVAVILKKAKAAEAKRRTQLLTFLMMMGISIIFWSLYMLLPSVLTLFVARNVNRTFLGFTIPASDYIGLNPVCIIVLGALFSGLWLVLQKYKHNFSSLKKFTLGIIAMAAAYLVLTISTGFTNQSGMIGTSWVIIASIFIATGELCVFPIGTAMIGRFASKQQEGTFMGIWLLSIGIGSIFSGYLAKTIRSSQHLLNPLTTNTIYMKNFLQFGLIALAAAILIILLLRRMGSIIET